MAATRECSRPAQPAPSEASRPRFDVDGSGDIDGEELGAVAAELGMAMSAAEVRRRWRQHPPPPPTVAAPPPPPPHGMIGTAPPPSASPPPSPARDRWRR